MKELIGLRRGDAAIVGGGLTGLLLASSLSQAGMRVLVLDTSESRLPPGSELATTLYLPAYQRICTVHVVDTARFYAAELTGHLSELLDAPPPYVQPTAATLYARTSDELPRLTAQTELLQQLGIAASASGDTGGCPFPVEAALTAPHQALIDMAQWRHALMRNIRLCGGRIYSSAAIASLSSGRVCTASGCMEAPLIVFADTLPPTAGTLAHPLLLERRLLVYRELHGTMPLNGSQLPADADGLTLHPMPGGAMACWDASRCGTRHEQERLRAFDATLSARLPDWQQGATQHAYATFSLDGLPVIGNLPGTRHLIAAGTGQTGIPGAMHAAAVLSRRILAHPLPEDRRYAPDRPLPQVFTRTLQRQYRSIRLRSLLRRGAPVCSHCRARMRFCIPLAYWACPSCGSVFDMLGQVVCGPAVREASLFARQRQDW